MRAPVVVPVCTTSRRGVGLGNELITWGKAIRVAKSVGGTALQPAWWGNPRKYGRVLGGMPLDRVAYRLIRALPSAEEFTAAQYRATGALDVGRAYTIHRESVGGGLPRLIWIRDLWGGVPSVAGAREDLRAALLACRGVPMRVARNSAARDSESLTVAVHVRAGDFRAPEDGDSNSSPYVNRRLPIGWYTEVVASIRSHITPPPTVQVFCDSPAEYDWTRIFGPNVDVVPSSTGPAEDIGDLISMSNAEVFIASRSTYSAWAALFGAEHDQIYCWYDNAISWQGDWGTPWPHGDAQEVSPLSFHETHDHGDLSRGVALGRSASLPDETLTFLQLRSDQRAKGVDPVRTGWFRRRATR